MPNKNSKKSTKRTSQNKNVKTKKQDTTNKSTNSKKSKNVKKQHPKLKLALKILLVIFLLLCVVGAGVIAAMMFGLFGDDFDITKEELTIGVSNSIVLDKDGNGKLAKLKTLQEEFPGLSEQQIIDQAFNGDREAYENDYKRRINPTLTDENGYYEFRGLTLNRKYVVKFTYNGQDYMPTEYLTKLDDYS